jgi:hypothetical protein
MTIFMQAAKKKLRFNSQRGILSVEDLWDIHLEELNALVIELKEAASKADAPSYLEDLTEKNGEVETKLRFQVAEAVIIARVEEVQAREKASESKLKRDKLLAIIASKEAQKLEENDIESLKEMAESLV